MRPHKAACDPVRGGEVSQSSWGQICLVLESIRLGKVKEGSLQPPPEAGGASLSGHPGESPQAASWDGACVFPTWPPTSAFSTAARVCQNVRQKTSNNNLMPPLLKPLEWFPSLLRGQARCSPLLRPHSYLPSPPPPGIEAPPSLRGLLTVPALHLLFPMP